MFDIPLLYETWKEIDLANKKLLSLLRRLDGHKNSYHSDEDFKKQVSKFNANLVEIHHRIAELNAVADQFNKDLQEETEINQETYFNNRRTINRRSSERRTSDRRDSAECN